MMRRPKKMKSRNTRTKAAFCSKVRELTGRAEPEVDMVVLKSSPVIVRSILAPIVLRLTTC